MVAKELLNDTIYTVNYFTKYYGHSQFDLYSFLATFALLVQQLQTETAVLDFFVTSFSSFQHLIKGMAKANVSFLAHVFRISSCPSPLLMIQTWMSTPTTSQIASLVRYTYLPDVALFRRVSTRR